MAKTLGPYIVEELQRLKICAPPTPSSQKSAAATDISQIVADFAHATMRRIVEIEGTGSKMARDELGVLF
jgi:hypothetical protein